MNSKIESLLKQAAAEADSSATETSSVTSATRHFPAKDEAEKAFRMLRDKLFSVEFWNDKSEISSFAHYDRDGNALPQKPVAVGSMIKVSLPASGKDDWVKISEIDDSSEEIVLTLQPSFDPTDAEEKKSTSHFFVDTSTNNFCLQRHDTKINFYVIGVGERTNTEETDGLLETIRNVAASNLGCLLGIQKSQWMTFCKNFLEFEKQ